MEMVNIKDNIQFFEAKDAPVFVVLQSQPSTLTAAANKQDWPFTIVCDPDGSVFQLYGVEAGGLLKYLHPAGLIAAIKATVKGFKHGKFEGKETQLPASLVVSPDKIIDFAYYGQNVSDVLSPRELAKNIP